MEHPGGAHGGIIRESEFQLYASTPTVFVRCKETATSNRSEILLRKTTTSDGENKGAARARTHDRFADRRDPVGASR